MLSAIVEQISNNGYGIFKGFYDISTIEKFSELCEKHSINRPFTKAKGRKIKVKSAKNLVAKTRDFDDFFSDSRLIAILERILSPAGHWGIKISDTGIKNVVAGLRAPLMHRDDDLYPQLARGTPFTVNSLLAIDAFSEEVGATKVVPGSHNWDRAVDPSEKAVSVLLDPGDLLVMDGRLWHQAGENTRCDKVRRAVNVYYCAAWCQPGHGIHCGMTEGEFSQLPSKIKKFL